MLGQGQPIKNLVAPFEIFYFILFAIFILHSRESALYRYTVYFERDIPTRLGVIISEVSGPPVFHIKVGSPFRCLAQGHNKRTCRLALHNLP